MVLQKINSALLELEQSIEKKFKAQDSNDLVNENMLLRESLETLQKDYDQLKETSVEVIKELNNSIQIIDEYFKKQNANNKNSK